MIITPWWKFIVLRGKGLPAKYDGLWEDIEELAKYGPIRLKDYGYKGMLFEATNEWEQREDGQVAVVFRYVPSEDE
jgi:hypothetical protein